ncbi:hypothetical protein LEP1GSC062_1742 [Leptospira alexanderi serovar Manhao 3 str. L 60]|uniref:Uncharacterized protein n=1 Tax=Leptospira alexanderi serovar Manhao 3 str. L 60 TaxID=1049759 RepID=V6HVF9_9LEPT|nr:hypothetical protein LEP1GSC062_1742 [Leptospira alexanderi serovar Manhao 3 str. L 60]
MICAKFFILHTPIEFSSSPKTVLGRNQTERNFGFFEKNSIFSEEAESFYLTTRNRRNFQEIKFFSGFDSMSKSDPI